MEKTGNECARDALGGAVLGASFAIAFVVRWRFLDLPLERDEGEYAYIAQLMLRGVPPYAEAYTMKFPGTPLVYALTFLVAGQSVAAIRIALLVVNFATAGILFALVSRTHGRNTSAIATGLFLLWSAMPELRIFWANTENFALLFGLTGWLLVAKALDATQRRHNFCLLGGGLAFGIALLMKQQAAFFVAPSIAYYALASGSPRTSIKGATRITVGILATLSILVVSMWALGVLSEFWFWTVTYAQSYASGNLGSRPLLTHARIALSMFGTASPLLDGILLLGIASLIWSQHSRRGRALWASLFAGGVAAALPGLRFSPHYFAFLLPAAALYAALGTLALARLVPPAARRATEVVVVAILFVAVVFGHRTAWFEWDNVQMSWNIYPTNAFPHSRIVGEHLRNRAAPGDTLAVLGSEPQIYFYSGLPGVTQYLYTYPFVEQHEHALEMHAEMMQQVDRGSPTYCVVVNSPASWGTDRLGQQGHILDWWSDYSAKTYELIGVVSDVGHGRATMAWDTAAQHSEPQSAVHFKIYRRR